MSDGAGDIKLGQVQCRSVQAQQAGLFALVGQQYFGLGRQRQFAMASAIGLAFGQHLAFGIKDF